MVVGSFARILAAASLICVTSITMEAAAEEACAPLVAITKALAEGKYHERPIAHGVAESGAMIVIYAAPDGSTWTVIGVRPSRADIGCILGTGTDWQVTAAIMPGKPS